MQFAARLMAGAVALLGMVSLSGGSAGAASPLGQLKCHVEPGVSFIVGSSRQVECVFTPSTGGPEHYKGSINKIGIDIGFQKGGTLLWAVLSPALTQGAGALAGNYVGASAEVAAGVGAGANALIGTNKIVLNPISVSGDTGINLAVGIADLDLKYAGQH